VRKVKPVSALRELGAETVGDSVILGDVAYEVEPGFFAEASVIQAAATAKPASAAAAANGRTPDGPASTPGARPFGAEALPKDLEDKRKEAEALARFLLENLT
jgi:hypothetical protein